MTNNPDVLVVGGGIAGSAAFEPETIDRILALR
jgi:hypothetical protein